MWLTEKSHAVQIASQGNYTYALNGTNGHYYTHSQVHATLQDWVLGQVTAGTVHIKECPKKFSVPANVAVIHEYQGVITLYDSSGSLTLTGSYLNAAMIKLDGVDITDNLDNPWQPPDFIVTLDGTTTKAKATATGLVTYSGSNAASVIQSAVNGGTYTFVREYTYNFTDAVVLGDGDLVESDGAVIVIQANNTEAFRMRSNNSTLRGFIVDGQRDKGFVGTDGVDMTRTANHENVVIEDMTFRHCRYGIFSSQDYWTDNFKIADVRLVDSGVYGIYLSDTKHLRMSRVLSEDAVSGHIRFSNVTDADINEFDGEAPVTTPEYGIFLTSMTDSVFTNIKVDGATKELIDIRSTGGLTFAQYELRNAGRSGFGVWANNITWIDGSVKGCGRSGIIWFDDGRNYIIAGSTFTDNGWYGLDFDDETVLNVERAANFFLCCPAHAATG